MEIDKRTTEIGDKTYTILLPPVETAMPLCTRVGIMLGPILLSIMSKTEEGGWGVFATAIMGAAPDKLDALMKDCRIAGKLSCNGTSVFADLEFTRHFNSHRRDLYPVHIWCIWECVRDFFPDLEIFISQMKMKFQAAEFQSPLAGK